MNTIKLNDYIEKFSEIKPQLDALLDNLTTQTVVIENDGCSNRVIAEVVKYLQRHGVQVTVESKGASALNRIFG